MNTFFFFRRLTATVCATMFLIISVTATGHAQEISASHLEAARKAISAIGATDQFDEFLPNVAMEIKMDLISNNPNHESVINKVVDEQVLAVVKRRGELETESARIYAKHFSEQELNDIAAFYTSPVGQKLLKNGPLAMADMMEFFATWRKEVVQELSTNIEKELGNMLGSQ